MKRIITLTLGLVAAAGLTHSTAAKMNVVATTTMVTDMVKEVGGDRVSVVGMMGAGVDPHLYKPASGDVVKLQRAKVIFYSGLMLEGRMADLFFKMARAGKRSTPSPSRSSKRSPRAAGVRGPLGSAHLGRPVFVEQMHCNGCRWTQCRRPGRQGVLHQARCLGG